MELVIFKRTFLDTRLSAKLKIPVIPHILDFNLFLAAYSTLQFIKFAQNFKKPLNIACKLRKFNGKITFLVNQNPVISGDQHKP